MPQAELLQRARELDLDLKTQRAENIIISAAEQLTPLGNMGETWQGLLEGKSGVVEYSCTNNSFVKIAAPVRFNPEDHFTKKELRGLSPLNAMGVTLAKKIAQGAKIVGEGGKLHPMVRAVDVGAFVGSGIGSAQGLIDVWRDLHKVNELGIEDMSTNSRRIHSTKGLEIFPEQLNASIAIALGIRGWGGSSVEACATSLGNMADAADKIQEGKIKAAMTGGFDNIFELYAEVAVGIFAGMRSVLSTRNEDPQRASRPFDKDRDGFVLGSGGGLVFMEEEEHAKRRGAPILAKVLGFRKSMDGSSPTNLDVDNVARTILSAMWNEKDKEFYEIDAIFAHATSTKEGDKAEVAVLRRIFGDKLKDIPITATKGNIGHLLGGAGVTNAITAIYALNEGRIPPILNLENPDPEFKDLFFVREKPLEREIKTALVLAYGFGGHNAVLVLGKYQNGNS